MEEAEPVLVDVQRAGDLIPRLGPRIILHAGPPLAWEAMCGPLRGAIAGAILYEGWPPVPDRATLAQLFAFIGGNDQFFLNIAMAMGKAIMDPVKGIAASTIVTAMSRNGTEFGIKVSGTGERWFTAPVEMPRGLYFPGFSEADANPDIGDSAIVETIGLGGMAMAASPAVAGFVGAGSAAH